MVVGLWRADDRPQAPGVANPDVVVDAALTVDHGAASAEIVASAPSTGREPTAYERMMFAMQTDAQTTPEQALATRLSRATTDDERRRMIELLGENGSHEALSALLRAAEQSSIRNDALAAIEYVVGVERLGDWVRLSRDAEVRGAILERMLAAGSPAALHSFLILAASPATRDEALAVADAVEQLPVAELVDALDADDRARRLAAALVLGHVNGPAVSEALIARVSQRGRAPIEAWVALLACRGEAVDQFLAVAQQQPRTLGQVNSARVYWARIVPQ